MGLLDWLKVSGHLLVTYICTSAGWMMWNWMVTALALGTTLVLYDGSPLHPHPGALWDLVRRITVNELCLIFFADILLRQSSNFLFFELEEGPKS